MRLAVLCITPSISVLSNLSIVYVLPDPVWLFADKQTLHPAKAYEHGQFFENLGGGTWEYFVEGKLFLPFFLLASISFL